MGNLLDFDPAIAPDVLRQTLRDVVNIILSLRTQEVCLDSLCIIYDSFEDPGMV